MYSFVVGLGRADLVGIDFTPATNKTTWMNDAPIGGSVNLFNDSIDYLLLDTDDGQVALSGVTKSTLKTASGNTIPSGPDTNLYVFDSYNRNGAGTIISVNYYEIPKDQDVVSVYFLKYDVLFSNEYGLNGVLPKISDILSAKPIDLLDAGAEQELHGSPLDDTLIISNDQIGHIQGYEGKDTITGGSGQDFIIAGIDADTINGSAGNDFSSGDEGGDTFVYTQTVLDSLVTGEQQYLNGGTFQSTQEADGEDDLLVLPGASSHYRITTTIGIDWYNTETTIAYFKDGFTSTTPDSEADSVIHTWQIEQVMFDTAIANLVTPQDTISEAMDLLNDAYLEENSAAEERGWRGLEAIELGIKPVNGSLDKGTLQDGVYTAKFEVKTGYAALDLILKSEVSCSVNVGIIGGQKTLSVSFEGSQDLWDFIIDISRNKILSAAIFGTMIPDLIPLFYSRFEPVIDGIKKYLSNYDNEIQQILVSGHSLGGALVQSFVHDLDEYSDKINAFTVGSIGAPVGDGGSNILNFYHWNDRVANLVSSNLAGATVFLTGRYTVGEALNHSAGSYSADVKFLVDQALTNLNFQTFSETASLAEALQSGSIWTDPSPEWTGRITLDVGTDGEDTLTSSVRSAMCMAGDGDDRIYVNMIGVSLQLPTVGKVEVRDGTLIDGGTEVENDVAILSFGLSYLSMSGVTWENDNGTVNITAEKLFLTATASFVDVERFVMAEGVYDADGELVDSQKPSFFSLFSSGLTGSVDRAESLPVFNLADNGKWADAGDGDMIVNGTASDDIIYLGLGNKRISAGAGNDVVIVRDSGNKAPGNSVFDGGKGADYVSGGKGDDVYLVDNAGDIVVDPEGHDIVKATVDFRLGDGLDDLQLLKTARRGSGNEHANHLTGNDRANELFGEAGNDVLSSGAGRDRLIGGLGLDRLLGGADADTFVYQSVTESKSGKGSDRIVDFSRAQGDRIDLSFIDVDAATDGDQAFLFIGKQAFHHIAGELQTVRSETATTIFGDVDGDGVADLEIRLTNHPVLKAVDFIM